MVQSRMSSRSGKDPGFHHRRGYWAGKGKLGRVLSPAISRDENKDEYVIYVAIPGMQRRDFTITINKRSILLSADKKYGLHDLSINEEEDCLHWSKTFTLPEDADTMMTAAVYRNGELEIHIPKGENSFRISPIEVFVY